MGEVESQQFRYWSRTAVRLLRSGALILITVLMLNEGLHYSAAWFSVYLSARDAKSAVWQVIKTSPDDRNAAAFAAQAACAKHDVVLEAYGHSVRKGTLGQLVVADMQVTKPVTGVLLVPLTMSIEQHRAASTWRSQRPVVQHRWQQQFSWIE